MHSPDDTIVAIATAPGTAGLAVLRLSGARALALADAVFRGRGALANADGNTLHHGWAHWPAAPRADAAPTPAPGARIDEVVAAVFRAPRSYTREHVVEFSCHGGARTAACLLEALCAAGARLARPGEFTLRAFLSGRLDLSQAEAVADVIGAESEAAREQAVGQLAGGLSRRLAAIESSLADAAAEVEARVDFAEDVGGIEVPEHVGRAIEHAGDELAALLMGAEWARSVREGVRVPLVGRPNAGKSSLFNALVGGDRSIVSALPGTTRDRVSESVELAGLQVTFSDTAGLRPGAGAIEALGIERTRSAMSEARVVLWVVDGTRALGEDDLAIAAELGGRRVVVALNKADVPCVAQEADVWSALASDAATVIAVSATRGDGVPALQAALVEAAGERSRGGAIPAASNPRHQQALSHARAGLLRAAAAAREGAPGEIVALELREALGAIGEVTGRNVSEALLDRIFDRFCIGK